MQRKFKIPVWYVAKFANLRDEFRLKNFPSGCRFDPLSVKEAGSSARSKGIEAGQVQPNDL